MKILFFFKQNFVTVISTIMMVVFISCSSTSDSEVDEMDNSEEVSKDITALLSMFDNQDAVSYSISNGKVTISTTNLPDYKSPYYKDTEWHNDLYADYSGSNSSFRLNPNRISEQNVTFTITLTPESASNKAQTPMGPIGISRNGVVFFNQYAAGMSALDGEINSFDGSFGHPAGNGMYHYHIEPTHLTDIYGEDAFLGLLADGFPVYGPKENDVTISSSDLDDYHGHFSATKEFPNGIYHYHITADAPYLNGDGFYGTPGTISQ